MTTDRPTQRNDTTTTSPSAASSISVASPKPTTIKCSKSPPSTAVNSTVTTDAEPQSASHSFAILSDEGQSLGSGGLAPLPLQYFLAGIALFDTSPN